MVVGACLLAFLSVLIFSSTPAVLQQQYPLRQDDIHYRTSALLHPKPLPNSTRALLYRSNISGTVFVPLPPARVSCARGILYIPSAAINTSTTTCQHIRHVRRISPQPSSLSFALVRGGTIVCQACAH